MNEVYCGALVLNLYNSPLHILFQLVVLVFKASSVVCFCQHLLKPHLKFKFNQQELIETKKKRSGKTHNLKLMTMLFHVW